MKKNLIQFLFLVAVIVLFFVILERDKKRTILNKQLRVDTTSKPVPDGTKVTSFYGK